MKELHHKNAPPTAAHYAAAVREEDWLYISGQLPLDPATRVRCPGGAREQTLQALQNAESLLQQEGGDRRSIVRTTAYIADMALWDEVNAAYRAFFGDHHPARSIVAVPEIHFGFLVEIDAVAHVTAPAPKPETPPMEFVCSKCGQTASVETRAPKCGCGGLWKLSFQPPKFDLNLVDKSVWGMFRYHRFMALQDDSWKSVTLGEGMSPLVRLDEDVLLKMDYYMPTLSFKDRGAAVLIAHCKSIGVEHVVQDSSGNAGNSVAAYCGRCGIGCDIYVPEGTSPGKIAMIQAHGATAHVVPGSRDHCADVCRAQVELEGKYYANHVYNPFFYEGTKTYIYEVYEQLGRIPEHLFIPLGNGTLFLGAVKALEELLAAGCIGHMPKIIAIQSERCDPFVQAAAEHSPVPAAVSPIPTMAEGIAIGVPMRGEEILELIYRYDMGLVTVPEDRILDARSHLARQGIYCEHTTAANLAAYWHWCDLHGKTPDSLLTMCGAGLKSDH